MQFHPIAFKLSSCHRADITPNPLFPLFISLPSSVHMFRVCPGKCYHLYNGLRASLMDAYQLPEIMRTPLEELCLQIKVVYVQRKRCGAALMPFLVFGVELPPHLP